MSASCAHFANTASWLLLLLLSAVLGQRRAPLQEFFLDSYNDTGPTSLLTVNSSHKLYRNLWYHNFRIYAISEASSPEDLKPQLTQNLGAIALPVQAAATFYGNVQTGKVAGNILLLDFPFASFPDNMGHWAEILAPAYSVLANRHWTAGLKPGQHHHLDAILLSNLRRDQLQGLDWVEDMLQLTVVPALPEDGSTPRIIYADELDLMDKAGWLAFEHIIVAHDRYTHPEGRGGFSNAEHARAFREAAYKHAGINMPAVAPKTITMLTAVGGEPVANVPEVTAALHDVGRALGLRVRPFSVTPGAPFSSFVAAMARTGVLVSRHGPLLANTMFLPPGAVVLELLPYNWDWKGISEIYVNLTRSLGDVHHLAWRARHPRWAQYNNIDEQRYADWTAEECSSRDCLEVHARASMVADAATLQEMLIDFLPKVFRGESVQSLAQPWPSASHGTRGADGLWWEK